MAKLNNRERVRLSEIANARNGSPEEFAPATTRKLLSLGLVQRRPVTGFLAVSTRVEITNAGRDVLAVA